MAVAYSLTKAQIRRKFKCSLDELKQREDVRIVPSVFPNKTIVVFLP